MATGERRLLIVGGGIAGIATALFAHRAGMLVDVFEAAALPANLGAALGLAPNGVSVLAALGLAETLIARSSPIDAFRFETASGRKLGTMEWGPPGRYRHPSISLSRNSLHDVLLTAAAEAGITIAYRKVLTGFDQDPDGVTASFSDGSTERGMALIGADGIRSTVRTFLLPDGPAPAFTGLVGSGGFVPRSAMQQIVGPDRGRLMTLSFGSGAFIGHTFGDRSEETGAYWWYALPREVPLTRNAQDVPGIETLLSLADWSDTTRRVLQATNRTFPVLNLFDVARLPCWSSGRVGLIGDAAHAVSPHSGQGASMALEDAFALVRALKAEPASPAQALQAFERERRERVEKVVQLGRRSGDQKRKGPIGTAVMTALMPIMLRLMPTPVWLLGWEAR